MWNQHLGIKKYKMLKDPNPHPYFQVLGLWLISGWFSSMVRDKHLSFFTLTVWFSQHNWLKRLCFPTHVLGAFDKHLLAWIPVAPPLLSTGSASCCVNTGDHGHHSWFPQLVTQVATSISSRFQNPSCGHSSGSMACFVLATSSVFLWWPSIHCPSMLHWILGSESKVYPAVMMCSSTSEERSLAATTSPHAWQHWGWHPLSAYILVLTALSGHDL